MKYTLIIHILLISILAQAQTEDGLYVHFSFDNNDLSNETDNGINNALWQGTATFDCGVKGNAVVFNGSTDNMSIPGLSSTINTKDITISFYIKPEATISSQVVLSSRDACDDEHAIGLTYFSNGNSISFLFSENSSKKVEFRPALESNSCWYQVVFVRKNNLNSLYINGVLIANEDSVTRVNVQTGSTLVFGGGPCISPSALPFKGLLDELKIYDKALSRDEIEASYLFPDHTAIERDTLIFLGASVDLDITETCATSFQWSPDQNIDNIFVPDPVVTPTETTTYTVDFNHGSCVARDSVLIIVVDPSNVECSSVFLPNAFTPNGDGRNDTYGISLPEAIEELISFEIFDRWGGRVFYTDNPKEKWDGSFNGQEMNPGVFLYRVHYKCSDKEESKVGSVTILR